MASLWFYAEELSPGVGLDPGLLFLQGREQSCRLLPGSNCGLEALGADAYLAGLAGHTWSGGQQAGPRGQQAAGTAVTAKASARLRAAQGPPSAQRHLPLGKLDAGCSLDGVS